MSGPGGDFVRIYDSTGKPISASNPLFVNIQGATTPYKYIAAASANQDSQVVKAAAGTIVSFHAGNVHATAVRFLKIYDKASAPTSADVPIATFPLAPGGGGVACQPVRIPFLNGIAFRLTTGIADNDAGAAGAGDVVVNMEYL